jgi:hypothetical protein
MPNINEVTLRAVRSLWAEKRARAEAGEYVDGEAYTDLVLGLVDALDNMAARNLELQRVATSHLESSIAHDRVRVREAKLGRVARDAVTACMNGKIKRSAVHTLVAAEAEKQGFVTLGARK